MGTDRCGSIPGAASPSPPCSRLAALARLAVSSRVAVPGPVRHLQERLLVVVLVVRSARIFRWRKSHLSGDCHLSLKANGVCFYEGGNMAGLIILLLILWIIGGIAGLLIKGLLWLFWAW